MPTKQIHPNNIGIKYALIVLGVGGEQVKIFGMTKAVSDRDICFIKAVLLLCEHRRFQLILRRIT